MNGLILNKFLSMYLVLLIYEFSVYLVMCHSYPIKTSKSKAYLLALLFASFVPLNNTLSNLYLGSGIIAETPEIIILNNCIMILEQLLLLVFIIIVLDIEWYRCFWLTILLHALLVLPFQILYYQQFTYMTDTYDSMIRPVTAENLPQYLLIIAISMAWGGLFLYFSKHIKKLRKVHRMTKWSWYALYAVYTFIVLNTTRRYHYQEGDSTVVFRGIDNYRLLLFLIITIIVIMFLSISYSDRKLLKVENNLLREQIEAQYENYLLAQQQEMKIHKLYHDIGNHINTIQILVNNGETLEAKAYTENLALQYQNISKDTYCSNKIINAVLTQKVKTFNQSEISYDIDIKLPEELLIRDIDLMSVYSNLLDNAIESCQRNKNAENYIKIKTSMHGDYLVVKIVNSKPQDTTPSRDKHCFTTWKKDKSMHGYGLRILEEIVERYDGQKEFMDKGSEFSAMVMLKTNRKKIK